MKNSTISVRVESDIKYEAESILEKLGVPISVVIDSLYRQIIYRNGIPFSLTLPKDSKIPDSLSEVELNAKLSHSYSQAINGEGKRASEVFEELEKSF